MCECNVNVLCVVGVAGASEQNVLAADRAWHRPR